jgi:polyhydroxybutyrate depolymerase
MLPKSKVGFVEMLCAIKIPHAQVKVIEVHFLSRLSALCHFVASRRAASGFRLLRILTAAAICLAVATQTRAEVMRFTVDGAQREALIFPPSKTSGAAERSPVLFAFHWHGGTMQEAAEGMQFQKLWPEAIVVYMQGLRTRIYVDPLGLERGWQQEPGQFGDRDLKFFDAVLSAVRMMFPVDDNRIYATGFSNGGIFTYLLWGTRGKTFAALAPVGAQKFPAVHLTVPRPILHIAGEQDSVVPFKEQLQSIGMARELNGSDQKGESCGEYCTTYASSRGAPVVSYIHPAGHVYPTGASEMIVRFFKEYKRGE